VDDRDAELERLRRLAYSRTGTPAHRERLAELEYEHATAPAPTDVESERTAELPERLDEAPARSDVVAAAIERSRRPRRGALVLAAVAGAVGGAALATAITLSLVNVTPEEQPPGASALTVFDRGAGSVDDVSNLEVPLDQLLRDYRGPLLDGARDLALRWVGSPSGHEAYAVRWTNDDGVHVCLIVESSGGAERGCVSEDEFLETGIRMSAYGLDLKWGPIGTEVWATG
jgi:hypothetical protein